MAYFYTDLIRATYRGEMAHRHVTAISGYHRIQASPGYRAAANYVAQQLSEAGLQVRVLGYQADGLSRFWSSPSFLEWSCDAATLHLLPSDRGALPALLCDYAVAPTSLIQRSIPVEGEFEVVAARGKGGIERADYDGLDLAGKMVLTNKPVGRVAAIAVRELGAAGILFDGMEAGGRSELDLPDALQYTSFWWAGQTTPDAWGFVVSPRQGRELRKRLAQGERLRVRALIDSDLYPGAIEVVEALLPGDEMADDQEILLVSHLCHPQPGAHDNASGAAALLEAAVTLARLISDGRLPAPRRGIRFIWPPEMTGTYAYLAESFGASGTCEASVGGTRRFVAGLNLDMVGADQSKTGGQWELVSLPLASASFSDHLLSWLREPFLRGIRYTESRFSAGSDHYILSDPTVGIPAPMIIHWPDRFYHTSEDTPEKVSPESLAASGSLAATYAYWLATAGSAEAEWLGHLMISRFAAWASRAAGAVVETVRGARTEEERAAAWNRYQKLNAFRADRMAAALADLSRLDPASAGRPHIGRERVMQRAATELLWATSVLDGLVHAGSLPPPSHLTAGKPVDHDARRAMHGASLTTGTAQPGSPGSAHDTVSGPAVDEGVSGPVGDAGAHDREPARAEAVAGVVHEKPGWELEAEHLVPCRPGPGPIDVAMCLQADHPEMLPRLWALHEAFGVHAHDYEPVLQYWSDGLRNIAEIGELAWLELDRAADEHTFAYFKLLSDAGLIELRRRDGDHSSSPKAPGAYAA